MLRIESVEFECSAAHFDECPREPAPEIAVSGRSNVGKSSLLNSLLGRKRLAHVSSTPGKTQLLNFFRVNGRFHIVDLPGYGFARVPEAVVRRWRHTMQGYLRQRVQLCGVIQLLDCRHAPSDLDREMIAWLLAEKLPFCLVPTKMDKLKRGERRAAMARILSVLELPPELPLIPYSSVDGEGRSELLAWLDEALSAGRTLMGGKVGGRGARGPNPERTGEDP